MRRKEISQMAEEKKYEITETKLKMYIGLAMADTIPEGTANATWNLSHMPIKHTAFRKS